MEEQRRVVEGLGTYLQFHLVVGTRPDQYKINEEAKQIISVGDLHFLSSKQMEFHFLQIAQQMAARPIIWIFYEPAYFY